MLMGAMDEDGTQMTPKQLRDEDHDAFSCRPRDHGADAFVDLVPAQPKSRGGSAAARRIAQACWAERAPGVADLERLPYLSAVINEVLRLYPPAYIMARTSIAPCSFGGYDFPAGSTMMVSQWVMHRDARYFDDPD